MWYVCVFGCFKAATIAVRSGERGGDEEKGVFLAKRRVPKKIVRVKKSKEEFSFYFHKNSTKRT